SLRRARAERGCADDADPLVAAAPGGTASSPVDGGGPRAGPGRRGDAFRRCATIIRRACALGDRGAGASGRWPSAPRAGRASVEEIHEDGVDLSEQGRRTTLRATR